MSVPPNPAMLHPEFQIRRRADGAFQGLVAATARLHDNRARML